MSSNYTETELQLILNKITSAQASTMIMNDGELYFAPDTAVYSVNNVTPTNGNVSIPEGANKDLSNLTSTGNSKFQAPVTGGASTITSSNLTTNRALVSNSSGKVAVSSVTLSELGYVSGVTSKIQTQLNNKVASNSAITGATKCKITYDSKGLVTSGANLSASDIPDLSSTYYLASNPNGFTSNVGTVTSVNNIQPVNGNVTIPTGSSLPSQTGQSGKFLTTDGTDASWATVTIPTVDTDDITISKNTDDELQSIGVIDNNSGNALKSWTGTKAQYDAIVTKDANTLYNITDDTDVTLSLLEMLYPVGAIYIGTMSTCPLAVLGVGTWQLKTSRFLVDKYSNGSDWWELYSDGWCRQGGRTSLITTNQNTSNYVEITFLKPYRDNNYTPALSILNGGNGYANLQETINLTSPTGMRLHMWGQSGSGINAFTWQTEGYTSTVTQLKRWERIL